MEILSRMYNYLNNKGELYFIEILQGSEFTPIGDVTFWQQDMPIVIGDKNHRGKGIGYKVLTALIDRAKTLGYDEIYVSEIFSYNIASQKPLKKLALRNIRTLIKALLIC